MKHYVGLDVSMKKTSICIVDECGNTVHEATISTDPHALADAIEQTGLRIKLVGFESGSLSHYLMEGFRERALNVVCIDARKMHSILSVKINKTDKNDARGIAKALRAGMFSVVHDKPKEAIDRGAVLSMRRCLVKQRTDIKNHIRGILKTYGIRLGSIGPEKFHERIKLHIDRLDPLVRETLEGLLDLFDAYNKKIFQVNQELLKISRKDKEVQRLMTVPGVGSIVALTYKAEIHNPHRFSNSRAVGAYLGMTPRQYSSGETSKQGGISRCGSKELRSLLNESGLVLLTRTKKWSKLKAWGLKLMRKKGIKKASLAVGRKLSVVMHRMLIEEKAFQYGEVNKKAA